ncbi:Glucose-1-phosphate adenylyltransferase large subunit 2 chloroplastic-like, partial [Trifolium medium]|nr:Glucose-1-phosphate adenylyltransferase large subunit 2 chloroplastic-like [Trifolium medium]
GYWEDIGTIKSFFDANLALMDKLPKFQLYDQSKSIFTSPRFLPPAKMEKCQVEKSIVGIRSKLDSGVQLKDTMMMGADYYQTEAEIASLLTARDVPIGIGKNTKIMKLVSLLPFTHEAQVYMRRRTGRCSLELLPLAHEAQVVAHEAQLAVYILLFIFCSRQEERERVYQGFFGTNIKLGSRGFLLGII